MRVTTPRANNNKSISPIQTQSNNKNMSPKPRTPPKSPLKTPKSISPLKKQPVK